MRAPAFRRRHRYGIVASGFSREIYLQIRLRETPTPPVEPAPIGSELDAVNPRLHFVVELERENKAARFKKRCDGTLR